MTHIELPGASSAARIAARTLRSFDLGEPASQATDARPTAVAWCFVGVSALCVVAMICAGIFGSHDCRVTPIPLGFGHQTEVSLALPADTPCTIMVQADSAPVDGLTIDAPPERGTLMPRGRTGVVYRPRPGFKGADAFDFSLRGRASDADETALIRVRASIN